MKRRLPHKVQIGMLWALFAFRSTAIAEQTLDPGAWLRFIGLEVRQLRVELFEHRLENEAEKITVLERDLAAARSERVALQAEESVHRQQVANLDAQLAEASVEPEARAQMEASKAELAGSATEKLRIAQNTLAAREAEIAERIRLAKAHLQTLATRMKQLASAASQ